MTNIQSDRVTLLIRTGDYFNDFDIDGLLSNRSLKLYSRNCDVLLDSGDDKMKVIKSDLINTKSSFTLNDGTITAIKQVSITVDSGDLNYLWSSDQVVFDLSDIEVINGVQRINKNSGNLYPDSIDTIISSDELGNWEIISPYVVPFSELQNEDNLPEIVYNESQPNNGFNQDVIQQQLIGLNIHMGYLVTVNKDNRDTDYLIRSNVLEILDYETSFI